MSIAGGWIYYTNEKSWGASILKIDYQGENNTFIYNFPENETIVIRDGVDDFTIDGDWLFYNYNSGLAGRYNMRTGEKYEKHDTDQARFCQINAIDGQIYAFTFERKCEKGYRGVGIIDHKTLTIKKVLISYEYDPDYNWFGGYALINEWLYYYYLNIEGEKLYRVKLDGSSKEPQLIATFQ